MRCAAHPISPTLRRMFIPIKRNALNMAATPAATAPVDATPSTLPLRLKARARKTLLSLLLIGVLLAAAASAAEAAYTWNARYSYSEMRNGPSGGHLVIANLYNPTGVSMRCWTDSSWWYGNYWSPRWFYVVAGWRGGWVHSSFVQQQNWTPHC
jgi:hypothetical protein